MLDPGPGRLSPAAACLSALGRLCVHTPAVELFPVHTIAFELPAGSICRYWTELARAAYAGGADFFVLLGDDVELWSPGWPGRIWGAFEDLAADRRVPVGFGCIALADRSFPGFPTFPVVGRIHLDIFGGEILPSCFVNQDGDPFLWQLYRRGSRVDCSPPGLISNLDAFAGGLAARGCCRIASLSTRSGAPKRPATKRCPAATGPTALSTGACWMGMEASLGGKPAVNSRRQGDGGGGGMAGGARPFRMPRGDPGCRRELELRCALRWVVP